jgi:peptide/nickel transport system substrate-binding protein
MIRKMLRLSFVFLLTFILGLALASCAAGGASEEVATEAPEVTQEEAAAEEEPAVESEEAAAPEDEQPLIVLLDNDEGPITPANFNTFIGYWLVGYVYDSLFARAPDLSIVPALATEATPSEDGLTWNVKLRDDVTWHDGQPFTAEDVIFSYDFLKAAGRAPNLAAVDTMEAQGDYELTINLSTPAPFFLSEGLAGYYILPEHIWRDQEPVSGELSQFQGQIGTGAYTLEEVVPGESYTFKANPDYYRGEPVVEAIIAKIVKDRTQQFNQLRTEAADAVLSSVPPAQVEQLQDSQDIALANGSDFFNYVFYMNGSRPPFDQVDVRQAIAKAIDTRSLVDIVFLGEGVELPLSWYHPDLPWAANIPHQYDPDGAMKLLEMAGLVDSDGDGIREFEGQPTSYEVLCDVNNPVEIRSTELIIGWLEDVGIGASQNCLDIDTSVTLIWPNFVAVPDPDYDMAIWGWSSGVQFQRGFLRGLLDGDFGGVGWANLTGIADPELDELMAEYVSNPDPERTEELALQIQERIADNLPFIPLMSPSGNFGYRPSAYDGWSYMKGTGIMPVWSYFPEEAQ